ncbi:MAG: sigma-54-dependent Fis family transcriptional regulator [Sedimentisphaerales bacterium]|nr:sigma-54-dependent Fis family transcriptional regulator [Sedimentisphaerales bacterium]
MSEKIPILIIEDETAHAEALAEALEREAYSVTTAANGREGLDKFQAGDFYVIVTDLKLGGETDGLGVLEEIVKSNQSCEVVLITAHSSIETCKTALREGAYDYIEKPIDLDLLRAVVNRAAEKVRLMRENQRLQTHLEDKFDFSGVIGESPAMLRIADKLNRAAASSLTVLLQGESGVGKELFAEAIHFNSPRKNKPFVPVNCAGLTDNLLESELFGHVKGAFTGALNDRKGYFAMADGGTLFLDEIGDMPLTMQAKLLRVLEDQIVIPVGSTQGTRVDVRIISATNQNLETKVEEKEFRQDLYFRIRGVNIEIPPLRQRREDIPLLLNHFLNEFAQSEDRPVRGFTPAALRSLKSYDWPGNVREMRNCVKTMVVLTDSELLDVADLPFEMHQQASGEETLSNLAGVNLNELEKTAIQRTLEMVNGNREMAAKMLGIGERTLYRKIKEYGLN